MNCFHEHNCQSTILFKYVKYLVWGQCVGVKEWSGSDVKVTLSVSNPQNTKRNMHIITTQHAIYLFIYFISLIPEAAGNMKLTQPKIQNGAGLVYSKTCSTETTTAGVSGIITVCLDSGMYNCVCSGVCLHVFYLLMVRL